MDNQSLFLSVQNFRNKRDGRATGMYLNNFEYKSEMSRIKNHDHRKKYHVLLKFY